MTPSVSAPSPTDSTLLAGLAQLGLSAALAPRLERYLDLIARWNRVYNLTAVREPAQMATRHLLDSLSILPYLGAGPLADLGSGAGLPGIPLAVARPALAVTLVEANGKKARFLRQAQRELGLDNVRVVQARAEALAGDGAYDCLTARAFGTLAELVRVGGHLLRPGGRLLAMKGRLPEEEIAALPPGWRLSRCHRLAVPGLDEERHLLVVEREFEATGRRTEHA